MDDSKNGSMSKTDFFVKLFDGVVSLAQEGKGDWRADQADPSLVRI